MSASLACLSLADDQPSSLRSAVSSAAGRRAVAILTLLCALLYLPGLGSIPPTDRDEARFMQATRQMIETGDYINIRFQDEPRNKKPAGIHWLQAAAVKLTGQTLSTFWPYRLPSVIAAWLAVLACFAFGARLFDHKTGFIGAGVLATSFMLVIEAHIAKTDATLLAATTIAMGALALMYADREQGRLAPVLAFWLALAAGSLTKGPVSLAVVLVSVMALGIADRGLGWLKRTRPLIGLPLALAVTLPWLLAASGGENGNNFIVEAVRGDLIPKLIGGQESHGAPPGAHLLAGLVTAWPWSLLLPFAIVVGWRRRAEPAIRFCLAWLLATWVLFEIVPTKLPHYTLPAFPALALLIAAALQSRSMAELARTKPGRAYRIIWSLLTVALGAGVIFASIAYGAHNLLPAGIAVGVLASGATLALRDFRGGRTVLLMGSAATAFMVVLSAGVVPQLSDLAVSRKLADAIAPHRAASPDPVAIAGYSEPSAVFLLGTDTILTSTAGVTDYLLAHPGALGVVETALVDDITRAVSGAGGSLRKLADIEGYNYSRGDPVALSVVSFVQQAPRP
ncbi:MAG: ArnT family glycosyltransferase [Rhodospirillaceae bacterium]